MQSASDVCRSVILSVITLVSPEQLKLDFNFCMHIEG